MRAQLLFGDITIGLCEHFLVRISVRIVVRKYQKNFNKFFLKLSPNLMPKIKLMANFKLILSAPPKLTLSENFWPVRIFSVNFLTDDINFLTHGNNFENSH